MFQFVSWKRFALGAALICLLLIGTMGTLSVAAQAANPHNPLYGIKLWEQQFQHPQMEATPTQAETNWNNAQRQLNTLASQADPKHAAAYRQSLGNLERQIDQLDRSIQTLPPGPDRDSLTNKLMTLKANARQMLRSLLPHLALSEQFLTTDELGRLGDTVPVIDSVAMVVTNSQKQATITITGTDLQPGAQLVMDGQLIGVSGTWQHGTGVFTMSWSDPGKKSPKTIGILNPDGTATQTSTFTFTLTEGNGNGNGKDKGNNNGNTNDNGNNGNNGNINNNGNNVTNNNNGNNGNTNDNGKGKGKGKGVATPTPTVTPTPTATP
jgi:hypothetical protein